MNPNINLSIPFLQECVARLRKLDGTGTAIICAGGAIRDLILGKPVKDLDFFIEGEPDDDFVYERLYKEFNCGVSSRIRDGSPNRWSMEQCSTISQIEGGGGYGSEKTRLTVYEVDSGWRCYPVQLIFHHHEDVREEAEHGFDFGFCRAWLDDRRLRLTSAFHEDRDNQRMTLYPEQHSDRQTTDARIERMRAKFPGWKLRDLRQRRSPEVRVWSPQTVEVDRLPELTS
jgi:hypothetical protein